MIREIEMNINRVMIAAICLSFVFLASCGARLRVARVASVEYRSVEGAAVRADYYSLSDGSLSFVKVALGDGTVLTLPNSASASGARYTDDREYVWWEKGGIAALEKRDESGEFRVIGSFSARTP